MDYRTIDIIKSQVNINSLIKNVTECKYFFENDYLLNMDKNVWNSKSKNTFNYNLQKLDSEVKNILEKLNQALLSIDNIKKIQEKFNMIKILEEENKMLENSVVQTDKIKLAQNLNKIEDLKNEINAIKANLINEWSM